MKISFFDDEPEIYPLQYGGKARTITNLAKEFVQCPDVEEVKILSRSIFSNKKLFEKDGIKYISLNDENTMEMLANECNDADIINIHCCSFTFPDIKCKAKKFYFLHDVLIATADKGSHLDKALGGNFDYIIAPSEFAKTEYDKNKKLFGRTVECLVIPRHIDENLFNKTSAINDIEQNDKIPELLKNIKSKYDNIIFFPSRPIAEKGGEYVIEFAKKVKEQELNICILGPFGENITLPDNCIDTGWIQSDLLKYFYSIAGITFNLSSLPESFSQVCIESVFCGTPVVAFDSGNIKNLSEVTKAILLCEKNIDSILNVTKKALLLKSNNEFMNTEINKISKIYNKNTIIKQYIELYKKVLEEKNGK